MIRSLLWKEYRETRMVWLTVAILGAMSVFLMPPIMAALQLGGTVEQRSSVVALLVVLNITYGLIAGALAFAGEREARTLTFLDTLTGNRGGIWWCKFLAGSVMALALGFFLTLVLNLAPIMDGLRGFPTLILASLAIEAFCWGLLGSSFCPTVMTGISGSVIVYLMLWIFGGGLAYRAGYATFILMRAILAIWVLIGSALLFSRKDRSAHRARALVATSSNKSLLPTTGLWASFWLLRRQHGFYLLLILLGSVLLGLSFGIRALRYWPLFTLIMGIACGTAVWASEQSGQHQRFLGEQRLPPRWTWGARSLFWLGFGALSIGLYYLGADVHRLLEISEPYSITSSPGLYPILESYGIQFSNISIFVCIWYFHAFAIGQFLSMVCEKPIVAVVVSLPCALALIAPWMPSYILGGLPLWQTLVVPLLLLVVSRKLYWYWISDRLSSAHAMAWMVVAPVGIGAWVVGCLWYRSVEIPKVGPPPGIEAFEAALPTGEENRAKMAITSALARMEAHRNTIGDFQMPRQPGREAPRWENELYAHGFKALPPDFGSWLERVMAGEWHKELREAVELPLGMLLDPRKEIDISTTLHERISGAMALLAAWMLELKSRGNPVESVEVLRTALALTRQWRSYGLALQTIMGLRFEITALMALEKWLQTGKTSTESARRAISVLLEHEKREPLMDSMIKLSYLRSWKWLAHSLWEHEAGQQRSSWELLGGQMTELSFLMPWEKERAQRLIDLCFKHHETAADPISAIHDYGSRWVWMVLPLDRPETCKKMHNAVVVLRHARILQLALGLYKKEKGTPAGSLKALVPEYLPSMPMDPYTGKPFSYRISEGEKIPVLTEEGRVVKTLEVKSGQGIIWSTGSDGVNNEATKSTEMESVEGTDLVFPVP